MGAGGGECGPHTCHELRSHAYMHLHVCGPHVILNACVLVLWVVVVGAIVMVSAGCPPTDVSCGSRCYDPLTHVCASPDFLCPSGTRINVELPASAPVNIHVSVDNCNQWSHQPTLLLIHLHVPPMMKAVVEDVIHPPLMYVP